MHLDYWFGSVLSILLCVYLIFALIRAERF